MNAKSGPNSTIPCNLSENVYVIFPGTAEDSALDPLVVQGQYREPTTLRFRPFPLLKFPLEKSNT